jgi:hypothetical protein
MKHHAFESEIFEAFRTNEKKIVKAANLLKENGYIVYKKNKYEKKPIR